MDFEQLTRAFHDTFGPGGDLTRIVAPGRVNLIGEHTDYNDGFVCPMAIEPSILYVCRRRQDGVIRMASSQFPGAIESFSINEPIVPIKPDEHWMNYVRGMAHELKDAGIPLQGMDCLLANTLPPNSGLSSSAALEMGVGRALLAMAGETMDSPRLALLGQKAEHKFPKVMCGIMDQMIVANGRAGHAMLMDCRSLERTYFPLDGRDISVIIVNSRHKHTLAAHEDTLPLPDGTVARGTPYNMRRLACEWAVKMIQRRHAGVKSLRDATMPQLDEARPLLNDVIYRRARHVIGEIDRCTRFADLLRASRYEEAGQLMLQSHAALRDDYEVSVEPIDALVEMAMSVKGVYGSRMTGAGFGGCTVSLVQPRSVDAFRQAVTRAYREKYNLDAEVIATQAADGARVVE
jgi:galactokinase